MNSRLISNSLVPLASFALCASLALAQQAPPPPANAPAQPAAPIERQAPPNGPMQPGMMHPHMMQQGPGGFHGNAMMSNRGNMHGGTFHGGLSNGFHIGPEGMWWKNPMVVQRLTLTPDQVKRMDGIFQESRLQLIDLRANVQKQEVMLEPLLSANPLDTVKAQAQIDKVADARASLEKANAKMLLGIRAVLTPDQWTKLHTRGDGAGTANQPGGPQGGGPGAPAGGPGRTRGMRPGSGNGLVAPSPQQ